MSRDAGTLNVHGSAVEIGGRGLLIVGASGAGKSGLALRLMRYGARLIADDRVILARRSGTIVASAPVALRGVIEARGVGLLRAHSVAAAPLALVVDLDPPAAARMPQPREIAYLDVQIELISGHGVSNIEVSLVQLLEFGRAT